jgi:hypothetical protein
MAVPTPAEIRDHLEGFNITASIISDTWIQNDLNNFIIPEWQDKTGMHLTAEQEATEYLSGNGQPLAFLSRKNVTSLVSAELVGGPSDVDAGLSLSSIILIGDRGMLKRRTGDISIGANTTWPKGTKNIKIVYKYGGDCPADVKQALILWSSNNILAHVANRTGGGDLSVKDWNRNYGKRGKYTHIRTQWMQQVMTVLRKYHTGVSQS